MSETQRPLSPHLQIYRWQLTMVMSISHRMAGIMLSLGAVYLAAWVVALAVGPEAFACINGLATAWYGQILLLAWTVALFYHLCNGIRHLAWDTGWGLELGRAYATGWAVLIATVVLTVGAWALALSA